MFSLLFLHVSARGKTAIYDGNVSRFLRLDRLCMQFGAPVQRLELGANHQL